MANQSAGDGLGLEASATKQKISQSKVTMSLRTECESGSSAQAEDIKKLSPTTQESLGLLLRSMSKGEARLDYNQSGKLVVDYKDKKKICWDGSKANIIAEPKADSEVLGKMDACLELIDYLKTEKPPSGVVLDKTKVAMKHGRYREGHEFTRTKRILGSGNSAGDIIIVKDTTTGLEHAQKTMMISCFRKEEIRCWVDMSESGRVPALYLFTIHDNKVQIHMEILHDAKTLRSIMDDHMENFYSKQELVKPFSLYILDGALDSIQKLVHKGWTHNDLHAGNVMAQLNPEESLTVKILDFGSAQSLEPPMGLNFHGFQADIAEILRIFSGLYTGQQFDNKQDIQKNYQEKLKEIADFHQMGDDDRKELFCLVDAAMKVVHPDDLYSYREHVKYRLDNAMDSLGGEQIVMRKVAAILFPEKFQHVHQTAGQDAADAYIPANSDQVDEDDFVETLHDHGDDQSNKMTSQPHDNMETDLDLVASQVTDDDLENLRSTLGVNMNV